MSIGDDFWIETGERPRAFKVDCKALRLRSTLAIVWGMTGVERG